MSKNKTGGNPRFQRGPIINGIKLLAEQTTTNHEPLEKCFYPSGEAVVLALHENLGTIMELTRDVFVTTFDLVLLDHSHGVLGGEAKKQSREETEKFSAAHQELRGILFSLWPDLPTASSLSSGYESESFFAPAVTMPLPARVKFMELTAGEQLKVMLQTKRVFVNGDTFLEYGGSGKQMPDTGFWSALFEFNAEHQCTDDEIWGAVFIEFGPGMFYPFWLERCVERDGGEARFIEQLIHSELIDTPFWALPGPFHACALEWGMDRKSGIFELKRFGAVPESAAG
jgi:hypothetical protein